VHEVYFHSLKREEFLWRGMKNLQVEYCITFAFRYWFRFSPRVTPCRVISFYCSRFMLHECAWYLKMRTTMWYRITKTHSQRCSLKVSSHFISSRKFDKIFSTLLIHLNFLHAWKIYRHYSVKMNDTK
jgi:hypothetical protein